MELPALPGSLCEANGFLYDPDGNHYIVLAGGDGRRCAKLGDSIVLFIFSGVVYFPREPTPGLKGCSRSTRFDRSYSIAEKSSVRILHRTITLLYVLRLHRPCLQFWWLWQSWTTRREDISRCRVRKLLSNQGEKKYGTRKRSSWSLHSVLRQVSDARSPLSLDCP